MTLSKSVKQDIFEIAGLKAWLPGEQKKSLFERGGAVLRDKYKLCGTRGGPKPAKILLLLLIINII